MLSLEAYKQRDIQNGISLFEVMKKAGIVNLEEGLVLLKDYRDREIVKKSKIIGEGSDNIRRCQDCDRVLTRAATTGNVGSLKTPPKNRTSFSIEEENKNVLVYACKSCGWSEIVYANNNS